MMKERESSLLCKNTISVKNGLVVVLVDIYFRCALINIVHCIDNLVIPQLTTQPQAYYTPWLGTDCLSDYEKNNK